MDLFNDLEDWSIKLEPILVKYKMRKHPLNYNNIYQLMIMVILSAQDSDANINNIAPTLFKKFPNMNSLAQANYESLTPYLSTVRNFKTKAIWLLKIAEIIKSDENIPFSIEALTALKGIGRKSANVIMREAKVAPDGIIADLHVIRVSPRIGLTPVFKDGNRIEKELMNVLPRTIWGEIGMAISFLGREICRPTNPKCKICPIQNACQYTLKTI